MRSIVPNEERDLSGTDRSFALPFGPERLDLSSSTRLTAEGLRMALLGNPDFSRSLS
jgi:hypothetical protein